MFDLIQRIFMTASTGHNCGGFITDAEVPHRLVRKPPLPDVH